MEMRQLILSILLCLTAIPGSGQTESSAGTSQYKGFASSQKNGYLSYVGVSALPGRPADQHSSPHLSDINYEFHGKIGNSMSVPEASCYDAAGNLYITGKSGNTDSKSGDITILKVSTNGEILWTVRIPSPGFTANSGTAMALGSDGFLYVAGYLWQQNSTDMVCIKISTSGSIVWQTPVGEPDSFQIPKSLHISEAGDVYMAGITHQQSTVTYHISKLSANGTVLWQYTDLEFPTQTWNEPTKIMTDNEGQVIVTGTGFDGGAESKIVTLKLDAAGALVWRVLKNKTVLVDEQPNETSIRARDMTIDPQNNIYIAAQYSVGVFIHSLTLKYSANGVEAWEFVHERPEESTVLEDIEMHNGRVLAGGIHRGNNQDGYVLYQLNNDGTLAWSQSSIETPVYQHSFAMTILNEQLHLDGSFLNLDTNTNYLISKSYQISDGALIQTSEWSLEGSQSGFSLNNFLKPRYGDTTKTLVFSSVYPVLGTIVEVNRFERSTGTLSWRAQYAPENTIRATIGETVSDADSRVFSLVSRFYVNPENTNTIYQKSDLLKYDALGVLQQSVALDDSEGLPTVRLAIDREGNPIVLKRASSAETVTLMKLSNNLSELWSVSLPLPSSQSERILVDTQNNIYLISTESSTAAPEITKVAVRKINASGTLLYSQTYESADIGILRSFPSNARFIEGGDLLIAGVSTDGTTVGFNPVYQPFLLQLTPDGNPVFFTHYQVPNRTATLVDFVSLQDATLLVVNTEDTTSGDVDVQSFRVNAAGVALSQNNYSVDGTKVYLQKVLHAPTANKVFYVASNISESASNIGVTAWDTEGNLLHEFNLDSDNFYQDAYVDRQSVYVLSQAQNSLHFPYRLLNWVGPFISARITKLTHELQATENFPLLGSNYSLYEPKQFIPLANAHLLVSGRLFHEELFFEGLQYYSIGYEPELGLGEVPEESESVVYVYPNPATNTVSIHSKLGEGNFESVLMYDIHGRLVKQLVQDTRSAAVERPELNIADLAPGIYLLKITQNEQVFTAKLVKE